MDGENFDALIRRVGSEGSRRKVLRAGAGALAVSVVGLLGLSTFGEAEAKKSLAERQRVRKQKARKQAKKKAKQGPAGPAGPPGPPGPPGPTVTCTGATPVTCGTGCCSNNRPLCCADQFETSGGSCYRNDYQCCPVSLGGGGGACRDTQTCCPPDKFSQWWTCAPTGDATCCEADSGGWCFNDQKCCPADWTNEDNGGCCPEGSSGCCNLDSDCVLGDACSDGCCVPDS
jgi:hypothetical protein